MTLQRILLFLFILLTCLIGCNEDPSIVGVGLLPKSDFAAPQTDTIYATGHTTEQAMLFTGSIDRVMLGKNADCEAWMLIKFNLPDTMKGITITSATISLKTMYHFGDATGTLWFDLYHVKRDWTGDSIAYNDSLFATTTSSNYYDNNSPIAPNTSFNSPDDTSWVSFDIPSTEVSQWFILANSDSSNQGLLLKPNPTSSNNMIKGFYSFYASDTVSVYPVLTVQYKDTNGYPNTFVTSNGAAKYLAHANTTLQNKFNDRSDSLSYVQNGISYRATFHFDTLVTHLRPSTVLLHSAYIEVTLNSSSSIFNLNRTYLTDSLYAYFVLPDSTIYTSSITLSETNEQNHVYKFKVNSFVQAWLKNPSLIKKIFITGVNESLTFDRFALYGNNAALVSERPRLIITYSTSK